MSQSTAPPVNCDKLYPSLKVGNIHEAASFYTEKLGFRLGFFWGDPPDMAGVNLGNVSMHLFQGEEPAIGKGDVYFEIDNVDELYEFHRSNEVDMFGPPQIKPYGMRDYHLRDPYGNILGFGQYVMSTEPKLKIERVAVPVRLEKRMAALLKDLAEHKKMSVDSTLEETLLHTFEPYGDGVASPHTKADIRYIQELKKKHGIDYDCHASYRFVE